MPREQELLFLITGFDFFSFLITDFGLASILKAGFSGLTNFRFLVVILQLPSTLMDGHVVEQIHVDVVEELVDHLHGEGHHGMLHLVMEIWQVLVGTRV